MFVGTPGEEPKVYEILHNHAILLRSQFAKDIPREDTAALLEETAATIEHIHKKIDHLIARLDAQL